MMELTSEKGLWKTSLCSDPVDLPDSAAGSSLSPCVCPLVINSLLIHLDFNVWKQSPLLSLVAQLAMYMLGWYSKYLATSRAQAPTSQEGWRGKHCNSGFSDLLQPFQPDLLNWVKSARKALFLLRFYSIFCSATIFFSTVVKYS